MQVSALLLLIGAAALAGISTAKMQCAPHVVAAAAGIHLNIVGQEAELKAVRALQKIESSASSHEYALKFGLAKGELVADIEGGMAIRAFNQKVLPSGNDATAGLKTVKGAQHTELKLAKSLTGKAEHDRKTLATLVADIEAGTAQNKKNLAAAIQGCKLGVSFSK